MQSGFNNVTKADDLNTRLSEVFSELSDILRMHAGPFASDAILGSHLRHANDVDEFSKDGIKIMMTCLSSEDVCTRLAVRLARFVGVCVDSRCHDGTTTSMLLFSRLAQVCTKFISSDISSRDRYLQIIKTQDFIKDALECINEIRITDEDLLEKALELGADTTIDDVRGAIAYHMAMISSKGNDDLSSKISTLIRHSPKKMYDIFAKPTNLIEMEERFVLQKQDYNLSMLAQIGNFQQLNRANGMEWASDDCCIFATGNDIVKDSWEGMFLASFISQAPNWRADLEPMFGVEHGWEHYHQNRRHLIIIAPLIADSHLEAVITEFNRTHPENMISYFSATMHPRMRQSWNKAIHYMAGKPTFSEVSRLGADRSIIGLDGRPIVARFTGRYLTIDNLYEKDGRVLHPYLHDEQTFPKFNEFVKETEESLDFATGNATNPALDKNEVAYLGNLYRNMISQDVYNLDVGGSVHDQRANGTVYEDSIGSALSAISEGLVLGGYIHIIRKLKTKYPEFTDAILEVVADSVRCNPDDLFEMIADDIEITKWHYVVADVEQFVKGEPHVSLECIDAHHIHAFLNREKGKPVLLQAWAGYEEQFKRFGDILPRLTNTTHLLDKRVSENDNID